MDIASGDKRPSPEALLREAENGTRGRLKIFLVRPRASAKLMKCCSRLRPSSARAPTWSWVSSRLTAARKPRALVAGLEVIPRRNVVYKGRILTEMDIDAILARHPSSFSSTNSPIRTRPRAATPSATLDVEELLAAGIDVYTTVNIQHIDSLNDVVARITHTRVRETIPDSVVDHADDIEVIDLTPDDLLARLREGKVYVGDRAVRAIDNFSRGNLTALRELALRRTAQRVDAQMVDYMQSHAIDGPWPAGERLLVAIDGEGGGAALVRRRGAWLNICAHPGPRCTSKHHTNCDATKPNARRSPRPCNWQHGSEAPPSPSPARMRQRRSSTTLIRIT